MKFPNRAKTQKLFEFTLIQCEKRALVWIWVQVLQQEDQTFFKWTNIFFLHRQILFDLSDHRVQTPPPPLPLRIK
jgi:hypothetical protein